MDSKKIAFPVRYTEPVPDGFTLESVDVLLALHPVTIPVFVGESSSVVLLDEDMSDRCILHEEEIPLMPCAETKVTIVHGFPDAKEAEQRRLDFEATHQPALKILQKHAGLFGLREVVLHVDVPSVHGPLPLRGSDVLDVLIFTSPAHSPNDRDVLRQICGLPISSMQGGFPVLLDACPIRGGVLMEKEKAIAQYIDNTIYILFPPSLLNDHGGVYASTCFSQVLLDILSLWYFKSSGRNEEANPRTLPLSLGGIQEEFTRVEKKIRGERAQNIMKIEKHLRSLEAELLEYRRKLHEVRFRNSRPTFYDPPLCGGSLEELAASLVHFNEHPQIAKIELLSNVGILIHTNEVCIAHEGSVYRIGTFGILFRYDGFIDIWSLNSFHPEGEPHPHISISGGACYGNAGDAIRLALGEYRFGDAIEYFLMWLVEGYTVENVIEHPVHEWPVVNSAVEVL